MLHVAMSERIDYMVKMVNHIALYNAVFYLVILL